MIPEHVLNPVQRFRLKAGRVFYLASSRLISRSKYHLANWVKARPGNRAGFFVSGSAMYGVIASRVIVPRLERTNPGMFQAANHVWRSPSVRPFLFSSCYLLFSSCYCAFSVLLFFSQTPHFLGSSCMSALYFSCCLQECSWSAPRK